MYTCFVIILLKTQPGFRKGYSDDFNVKGCTAVLTDLSKTFDCFLHELLISKMHEFDLTYLSDNFKTITF